MTSNKERAEVLQMKGIADAIRIHARVTGLVQGVGYRYFVFNTARKLGLSGWVRNCADGSVEVEAQGERAVLAQLISQLNTGPRWAQVSHVETQPIKLRHGANAQGFRVEPGW
jgi:acylphosphatase